MNEYSLFQDELMHFGIKGMHWGVRRYQNPDGSLTPAGKKRNKDKNLNKSDDIKNKIDSVKDMSDDELRSKINRLRLEKDYKDLLYNAYKKPIKTKTSTTLDSLKRIPANVLTKSINDVSSTLLTSALKSPFASILEKDKK